MIHREFLVKVIAIYKLNFSDGIGFALSIDKRICQKLAQFLSYKMFLEKE